MAEVEVRALGPDDVDDMVDLDEQSATRSMTRGRTMLRTRTRRTVTSGASLPMMSWSVFA